MGVVGATPTDLRPSPAPPPQPHHTTESYKCIYLPQRAGVLRGLIQDPANRLLRIPLPRTRVNRTFPSYAPEIRRCHHGGGKAPSAFRSIREEPRHGRSRARPRCPDRPRTGHGPVVRPQEPPGGTAISRGRRRSGSAGGAQKVARHHGKGNMGARTYHGGYLLPRGRGGLLGRARP